MTEKELRKLNRYQLLEILVKQTERADKLQQKVNKLEEQLEHQEISLSELGSIAEAAVKISGVLEASQRAADLYLSSAKKKADDILRCARYEAIAIISQAEEKARYISNAQQAKLRQQQESDR